MGQGHIDIFIHSNHFKTMINPYQCIAYWDNLAGKFIYDIQNHWWTYNTTEQKKRVIIWYDIWYGVIWCDVMWYDVIWCDVVCNIFEIWNRMMYLRVVTKKPCPAIALVIVDLYHGTQVFFFQFTVGIRTLHHKLSTIFLVKYETGWRQQNMGGYSSACFHEYTT